MPCTDVVFASFVGVILGLYDLYEMKYLNKLHCNIYGHMDWTNMRLLGVTTVTQSNNQQSGTEHPQLIRSFFLMDFFPDEDTSFFFTFEVEDKIDSKIGMDHHEPMHIDTDSPGCTVVMAEGQALTGCVDGSLIFWSMVDQKITGNLYDPTMCRLMLAGKMNNISLSGRPAHDGKVTCLKVSTDARFAVTGGVDKKVKVWTLKDNGLLHILLGHSAQVRKINHYCMEPFAIQNLDLNSCCHI